MKRKLTFLIAVFLGLVLLSALPAAVSHAQDFQGAEIVSFDCDGFKIGINLASGTSLPALINFQFELERTNPPGPPVSVSGLLLQTQDLQVTFFSWGLFPGIYVLPNGTLAAGDYDIPTVVLPGFGSTAGTVNLLGSNTTFPLHFSDEPITCEGEFPECDLVVDKKCLVEVPPAGLECEEKVQAMLLRYIGPDMLNVDVAFDPDKSPTVEYSGVDLISGVTILKMDIAENGFTIDAKPDENELGAKTKILIDGVLTEIIHTSCSAPFVAGAPAPLDGGSPGFTGNPDPDKGDPSPNWFVESFIDKEDPNTIVSPPEPPVLSDECEIVLTPPPSCDTDGKPSSLTFQYTGEDCTFSDNNQGDKAKCEDISPLGQPVQVVYTGKNKDKFTVSPDTESINVGDQVTIARTDGKNFESNTKVEIRQSGTAVQKLEIHTSCSQPLELGDQFGSLVLTAFDGKSGANNEVTYFYAVTNNGDPVTNVMLEDRVGVNVVFSTQLPDLDTGDSASASDTRSISETTTNEVTVTGLLVSGDECSDTDEVTVTVEEPPPGPVVCTTKVQAMLLKYTGATSLTNVEFDPDKGASVTYPTVNPGDTLSMPAQNDWTIDATVSGEEELGAKTKILVDGVLTEILHTSCSAPFAAGTLAPLDGGSPGVPGNPDPDKGDPSPNWFVESFSQK